MIRLFVLVLLAANVLLFAWSRWVSRDQPMLVTPPPDFVARADARFATPPAVPACTTVGPLVDEAQAVQLEQLLRDMQLAPARRSATAQVHDGWWVYVATPDALAQARTLRAIQRAGVRDASAMPDDAEFRVSVGLFREAEGANNRAALVRELQLDAMVEERTVPQQQLWFDLPGIARERIDVARLDAGGVGLHDLRIEECPAPGTADAAQV
jgi:hypothetical protein